MQHTIKLFSILAGLGVGVLFGLPVHAQTIIVENETDGDCLTNSGSFVDEGCVLDGGGPTIVQQEVNFTYGINNLSTIGLNTHWNLAPSGSDTVTVSGYNSNGIKLFEKTEDQDLFYPGAIEITLDTPYLLSQYGEASTTPRYIQFAFSGTEPKPFISGPQYGIPHVGTFNSTTLGGLPDNYAARVKGTCSTLNDICLRDRMNSTQSGVTETKQLAFYYIQANTDDVLTIDFPVDQQTYNTNLTAYGSCNTAFEFSIFNNATATGTPISGSTLACQTNQWEYNLGLLEQGYWSLTASSTDQFDEVTFFFLAQSQLTFTTTTATSIPSLVIGNTDASTGLRELISGLPLAGDFLIGIADFITNIFQTFFNWVLSFKPYSYIPDVIEAVNDGLLIDDATEDNIFASTTIAVSSQHFSFDGPLFNESSVTEIVSQESWNNLRPLFSVLIWFSFFLYIFDLIKNRLA